MEILTKEYTYKSATGLADIYAKAWIPNGTEIKAVVQIAHGMAEHIERYEGFAYHLCQNGFAVFANDHIGHGKSINNNDDLGFFGEEGGYEAFVEDCKQLTDIAKNEFPGKPFIFFGHSMGSFIARKYTQQYGTGIDGAIYCGTSGYNPGASIAIKLSNFFIKNKGYHYRSKLIDNLAFGANNKKFEKRTNFDWLTRDNVIVDKYIADDKCGFLFTVAGFKDVFSILSEVNKKSWYKNLPKTFPILMISGAYDPVGNYSKGVNEVYHQLKDTGHTVTLKLYPDCRHEVLNELNKQDVYADVVNWINETVKK